MKKIYLLAIPVLLATACSQPEKVAAPAISASPEYPYKIEKPDQWQTDTSHANTLTALKFLKALETNDNTTAKACVADTMVFNYDGGTFKGAFGDWMAQMAEGMGDMKDIKMSIKDWQAVTDKDRNEQFVTVWYTQCWKDSKGKADSLSYTDHMQFKGGRIAQIDEFSRHFTMPSH
ncbi:nuclear transport factor 2 family protein [Mucilaginibacter myungsuensis]|uniref:Nuclear transport factor 2 family protein n=1 Tax=Mucilaginibacter myungsuensis TaxID=649104 RepID=A0A929PW93_9SPHI|nr:nuclear transport factor 2 family protein [Mucilaginibacter myungsuensis]MBE9662598.1 nuclear transport factor 2 family protein [Mucilaginibacter myungsuensis]MDN3598018.1 nuclear transport factor 2 family protein [Mucilaginibacter myungsuensis]